MMCFRLPLRHPATVSEHAELQNQLKVETTRCLSEVEANTKKGQTTTLPFFVLCSMWKNIFILDFLSLKSFVFKKKYCNFAKKITKIWIRQIKLIY